MSWSKSFLVLALASVWIFVGCSANPSSPDVDMTAPDSSSGSLSIGQAAAGRGNMDLGTIFVKSQGLYYDTFATADPLPNKGPFQLLYIGPNGPTTMYGPGDPGYRGGRWWVDDGANEGVREDDDTFFLCPLLPPGRETP